MADNNPELSQHNNVMAKVLNANKGVSNSITSLHHGDLHVPSLHADIVEPCISFIDLLEA